MCPERVWNQYAPPTASLTSRARDRAGHSWGIYRTASPRQRMVRIGCGGSPAGRQDSRKERDAQAEPSPKF